MNNNRKEVGTAQMFQVLISPRWITRMFLMPLLVVAQFAWAAVTDPGTIKFDHSKTAFSLTGAHIVARCASCHVDGVFKGTPRDCASCHVAGNRMGAQAKTTKHVATTAPCERCHQNTAWTPVKFNHVGVATGTCLTCHNGTATTGKPSGHMPTNDSCDACHKTINWQQLSAGGLPANHLPTMQTCSLCHSTGFGLNSGVMNHAGVVSGCMNCHNGQTFAVGMTPKSMPTNHLPTSNLPCENCHSTSNFISFVIPTSPTMMNHTGIVNGCANCHNGQSFIGVTPMSKAAFSSHMATSLDCSSCHSSTTSFLMANVTTPPIGHLPTTSLCTTCHSANFVPITGVMNHTGITTGCTTCHNGQVFTGVAPVSKPVNHLPTSMTCETCHSPASTNTGGFGPATPMRHTGIVGGCTNCHNGQSFAGVTPVSKPVNHLPTNMSCETCHSTSNTNPGGFGPATPMNHAGIVSGCATCHGFLGVGISFAGVTPMPQIASHMPTGSSPCEGCHTSTAPGGFLVATGGAKPSNHLPTTAACSVCHSAASYYPGVMNHAGAGVVSGCTTCHNGQVFAGVTPVSKPVSHLPTSAACENCHQPASTTSGGFANGAMNHVGIVSGCTNCHNGQAFAGITPKAKPPNHLPTSMSCETCHSTTAFLSFAGTAMMHTGIVNNCTLCHNGQAFAGVTPVSKSTRHIPYAANLNGGASMGCEFCHSPTVFTTFTTGLVTSTTMHNGTLGNGSGWCLNCHQTTWSAPLQTHSVNHDTPGSTDCSKSGCHRPIGGIGSSYTRWN